MIQDPLSRLCALRGKIPLRSSLPIFHFLLFTFYFLLAAALRINIPLRSSLPISHFLLFTFYFLLAAASGSACSHSDPLAGQPPLLPALCGDTVGNSTRVGQARIALDFFNGRPYIAYYDTEKRDLIFAHLPENGGKCPSDTTQTLTTTTEDVISEEGEVGTQESTTAAQTGAWAVETVDGETPDIDVGDYPDLVMDSDGLPHVVYFDRTNGDIRYAHQEPSGSWTILSDLDVNGTTGEWARLAIEESGGRVKVHLAYVDGDQGRVKYYALAGECTGGAEGKCPELIEPPQSVSGGNSTSPQYLDMKVDEGAVYVAYYASTSNGGQLRLAAKQTSSGKSPLSDPVLCAEKTSTGWCFQVVDLGKGLNLDNENPIDDVPASRSVGPFVSLQIDPLDSNRLHLAYADDANQLLKYAYFGPGDVCIDPLCWQFEIVEGKKVPVGQGIDLTLIEQTIKGEKQVVPVIAFKNHTGGDLRVAVRDHTNKTWDIYSADTAGNAGSAPAVGVARLKGELTIGLASVKQLESGTGLLNFRFFPIP